MERAFKELRILIKCRATDEDEQVSREMTREEKHQHDAGDCDNNFFPDGRGPVSIEATGDGIHEDQRAAT